MSRSSRLVALKAQPERDEPPACVRRSDLSDASSHRRELNLDPRAQPWRSALLTMPPVLASNNPIEHILDHRFFSIGPAGAPWGYFTMHIVTLLVGTSSPWVCSPSPRTRSRPARRRSATAATSPRGRFAQVIELLVVVLRDQMLVPILGEKQTRRYLPFLLSLFFFILMMNLLGLIPFTDLQHLLGMHSPVFGGTPTANIAINAALASVVFVVIQVHSFRELGVKGFFEHMCGGKDLLKGRISSCPSSRSSSWSNCSASS